MGEEEREMLNIHSLVKIKHTLLCLEAKKITLK